jgi:hypothetical protein
MSLSAMLLFKTQLFFVRWDSTALKPLSASKFILNVGLALLSGSLRLLQLFFVCLETLADNMLF